jgi:hypothetical protein
MDCTILPGEPAALAKGERLALGLRRGLAGLCAISS